MSSKLHQRPRPQADVPVGCDPVASARTTENDAISHPSGKEKHGRVMQILRGLSLLVFFFTCATTIQITQWIGAPLYWINRQLFYDYMAVTKQSFGLVITTMTYWWGPTTIRISGDASVAGQIRQLADGRVEFGFPERLVLIANHQIYTDWLYLWWVGYANSPRIHGNIYIILKESLKYVPIIGPGMMFYGFIFMSRKMAIDQPRIAHRLQKLQASHLDLDGKPYFDPMWLLLFPEGTNAASNSRDKSVKWAKKMGIDNPRHVLLPRSTGMYYCLTELKGSVKYVYDCTVAYEGIPRGDFGEDYFTLSSTYLQGRPPKSVNFYWRRFDIAKIPLDSPENFDSWLRSRWTEKDALMETFLSTGRLPSFPSTMEGGKDKYIETEVRTRYPFEIAQIFAVPGTVMMLYAIVEAFWRRHVIAH